MKISFSNSRITIADAKDIPALLALLNSAYRGEGSKKGWTTEQHLIAGETRTDHKTLERLIHDKSSVILKYCNDLLQIEGCVNLQKKETRVYLGMLAVSPHLQGLGIGKFLLQAAEEFAVQSGCNIIYMTVISVRTELINWYMRHGYQDSGERNPFIEDKLTGKHLQPLEMMVLEKPLDILSHKKG